MEYHISAKTGTVTALKDIKKGEQCFVSYIPLGTKEERERSLMPYGITCNCVKCILNV